MLKRQTRKLTITPPPTREEREQLAAGAASMPVEQTRITVAAMNTLQYGRYEANRRAVGPWLEAQTGKGWPEAAQDDAGLLLLEAGLRWARIAAAVQPPRVGRQHECRSGYDQKEKIGRQTGQAAQLNDQLGLFFG